jgi:hypothetical protein
VVRPTLREIKSPLALATLGAFFVPEPLGACLIVAAAIWWLCRKPFHDADLDVLPEAFDWRIDFYRFRAGHNAAVLLLLPDRIDDIVLKTPLRIECRLARSTVGLTENGGLKPGPRVTAANSDRLQTAGH